MGIMGYDFPLAHDQHSDGGRLQSIQLGSVLKNKLQLGVNGSN